MVAPDMLLASPPGPLAYLTSMASNSEKQIENLHFLDTKRGRSPLTGFYLIEHSRGEILAIGVCF